VRIDLGPEYVAIVGGGEILPAALPVILGASSVVAADSGAQFLKDNDIIPWVLVGDFDSCDPDVVSWMDECGSRVITLPRDKDKTDTEVALDMACNEGFKQAVLVGGLGGDRLEHSLANLSLLEAYAERGLDVVLFHRDTVIFGLMGRGDGAAVERSFRGKPGDWVSAFPVTREVRGVTTEGLRFPLSGATLTRGTTFGTSNEMTAGSASISVTEGFLLVVVTGGSPVAE
jgi:thiamine pyrophosphokinase